MARLRVDLGSTRLAFYLIAGLFILILISAVVPQRGVTDDLEMRWSGWLEAARPVIDALDLDRIFFSPVFHGLLGLLSLNLVFGNIRRFRAVYRLHGTLLRARHLGSIVFHLGLLVVLVGIMLNYLFHFRGVVALTEGQSMQDVAGEYMRTFEGPMFDERFGRFTLKMLDVDEEFPLNDGVTKAMEIEVRLDPEGPELRDTIRVNHHLSAEALEFHIGPEIGYSPELLVLDEAGNQRFRSFVRLATQEQGDAKIYADFITIPPDDINVRLEVTDGGMVTLISLDGEGVSLPETAIAPTETVTSGGMQFQVPRLRRWAYISVVSNPFLGVVFVGFWTTLGGLAVTFGSRLPRPRRVRK